MTEKDMVMDILSGVKASIAGYAKNITECSCPQLRTMFQQMRDADEKFQFELYTIASEKGYYTQPPKAMQKDIDSIKTALTNANKTPIGAGMGRI